MVKCSAKTLLQGLAELRIALTHESALTGRFRIWRLPDVMFVWLVIAQHRALSVRYLQPPFH